MLSRSPADLAVAATGQMTNASATSALTTRKRMSSQRLEPIAISVDRPQLVAISRPQIKLGANIGDMRIKCARGTVGVPSPDRLEAIGACESSTPCAEQKQGEREHLHGKI